MRMIITSIDSSHSWRKPFEAILIIKTSFMKCNVGNTDAFIRAVLGTLIWSTAFIFHSWYSMLGLVLLLTAIVGYCPLYRLLGINTERGEAQPGRQ